MMDDLEMRIENETENMNDELSRKVEGVALSKRFLSVRLYNCLKRAGFSYLSEVIGMDAKSIGEIRYIGKQSIEEFVCIKDFVIKSDRETIESFCNGKIAISKDIVLEGKNIISVAKGKPIEDNFSCINGEGQKYMDCPVLASDLSVRAYNALRRNKIDTVRQLAISNISVLQGIQGLGQKTIDEILTFVDNRTTVQSVLNASVNDPTEIKEAIGLINDFFKPCFESDFDQDTQLGLFNWLAKNMLHDGHLEQISVQSLKRIIYADPISNLIKERIIQLCGDNPFCEVNYECCKDELLRVYQLDNNSVGLFIDELIQSKRIINRGGYYFRYKCSLDEWINSLEGNTSISIDMRCQGKTLEEIGSDLGVTRERVRQIVSKGLRRKPVLFEDGYAKIFQKYGFSDDEFAHIFNIDIRAVYYLRLVYKKGSSDIHSFIQDEEVPKVCKDRVALAFKDKFLIFEGEVVSLKRDSLIELVLRKYYADIDGTIPEVETFYYDFLKANGLDKTDSYKFPTEHAFEARITDSAYCILKYGKRIRYYDTTQFNVFDFLSAVGFERYMDLEISTQKIFVDNLDLMETLDIRDEYELHNILRKNQKVLVNYHITVGRMPLIVVGNGNRDKQVRELLFQLAPITNEKLAWEYEVRYGVKKETVMANFFKIIDVYYHNGEFNVEQIEMNHDDFVALKEALVDDFYMWDEIVLIHSQIAGEGKEDELNAMTLKQIGFRVYSQYIIRNTFLTADSYFRSILTSSSNFNLDNFKPGIKSIQSFHAVLYGMRDNLDLIEIEKNSYASFDELKTRLFECEKEDLIDIGRRAINSCEEDVFTLVERKVGKSINPWSDIINNVYFLNSVVRVLPSIRTCVLGNVCIVARNGKEASQPGLLIEIVKKHGSLDFDQIVRIAYEEYGLSTNRYKVSYFLNNSDLIDIDEIVGVAKYRDYNNKSSIEESLWMGGSYGQLISEKKSIIDQSDDLVKLVYDGTEYESFVNSCDNKNILYMKELAEKNVESICKEIGLSRQIIMDIVRVYIDWVKGLRVHSEEVEDIVAMFFK